MSAGPPEQQAERARPSRRSILTAAAIAGSGALLGAGYLIEDDVLPGRVAIAGLLGQGSSAPDGVPDVPVGTVRQGSFRSEARGGVETNWKIAYPPGTDPDHPRTATGEPLGVCVVLHGKGADENAMITLGYPQFLAVAVRAGTPPFALASIYGGNAYWHPRRHGGDSGAMVLTEYLPLLAEAGLAAAPSDRIAFLGWSMGGYGSLLLASQLGPARVAAIAAESPALWLAPGDSAPGAFDDAQDFRAHDVFTRRRLLSRIPIRIDCGRADPFHTASKRFAAGLHPAAITDFGPGAHNGDFWRAKARKSIEFVGKHLSLPAQ